MNSTPGQAGTPPARRRWPRRLFALCAVALLLLALLWLLLWLAFPPERLAPMLLDRIGASMNLEISAEGDASSRLGAQPTFVLRNVVAREPGAAKPLLQVQRILVSLPWRTLRGLGDTLDITRVELDASVLDVPAMRHWLASRPPAETRLPTLADGLQVRDGRIDGGDWRVEALQLRIPHLEPSQALRATATGRYADATTHAPFDLVATLSRPGSGNELGLAGRVALEREGWRLPAWITLSGALHWDDGVRLLPAKFGASARYVAGATEIPFTLGAHGPLRSHGGAWTLAPAAIALRGDGVVPTLDAHGALALGQRLVLRLEGRIAEWPADWPALPPPLGQSREPLALAIDYADAADLSGPLQLRVARDDLRFDGRLRVPEVARWVGSIESGSPLPPIAGRLETPRIEVSGARLEGIVIEFEDETPHTDAPSP